ncbi:MAG: isopenicillin N synthase family dioxygenase [Planctomycetota bacterium]|jgi:isopenicillin N synthase-like dioxygenase
MQIPRIDLTRPGAEMDRTLLAALGEYGLVHVAGHGIEPALLDDFYREFIAFTDRPTDEKAGLGGADIWFQRGWTPPDTEKAVIAGGQPDFKECYFAAPEALDPSCAVDYPQVYAENVWPEGADAYRDLYLSLGGTLHALGRRLLAACARGLGLPEDTFETRIEGGAHVTRALRYLPLDGEQAERGVLWGEEHTDFNILTLLPGGRFFDPDGARCANPDPDAGLYLRARSGDRVPGRAPTGCITVQVGQQLEILTGGRLLATPHEITAPRQPGYTRCSAAHFVHLNGYEVVRPLEPFRTPEAMQAYSPPVLAGTYAMKTLVDIGLAPRESLDALGYRHYGRLAAQRAAEGR